MKIKDIIKGRYVYIELMTNPLWSLYDFFSETELRFIFGDECSKKDLSNLEDDKWSNHYIFRLNYSEEFAGYLRVVYVSRLNFVEIHGGGMHNSILHMNALTEAWFLIIHKCFEVFKVKKVYTSCFINNTKAYKFIVGTGFQELKRENDKNLINFVIKYSDFKIRSEKFVKLTFE